MDIIPITEKLKRITERFNLTEDENETIELSAKAILFIEMEYLKPKFIDFLKDFNKDVTNEQKEFLKKNIK